MFGLRVTTQLEKLHLEIKIRVGVAAEIEALVFKKYCLIQTLSNSLCLFLFHLILFDCNGAHHLKRVMTELNLLVLFGVEASLFAEIFRFFLVLSLVE